MQVTIALLNRPKAGVLCEFLAALENLSHKHSTWDGQHLLDFAIRAYQLNKQAEAGSNE